MVGERRVVLSKVQVLERQVSKQICTETHDKALHWPRLSIRDLTVRGPSYVQVRENLCRNPEPQERGRWRLRRYGAIIRRLG